ncbi:hypothetical protein MLD38_032508 [Melastoma candidum]|uniref:Uncharacterized protein n=1 Tax=Melastoma candidum TaxID=119954 RepID=A0ACB9M488_9MYRT|nr:hypothetical protein MLD38_032508 [Melastoma candidum]
MQGAISNKDISTGSGSKDGRRHTAYKGVRRRSSGKWVSEIREPRKPTRIWLGTFPTPEMAAVAYDVAALALKGWDAELNFPDSASSLPVPASLSPRDIQEAAARAASAVGAAGDALFHNAATLEQISGALHLVNAGDKDFVDEEMIFNMPNVLFNMAEGMLLSPPRLDMDYGAGTTVADEYYYLGNQGDDLWKFP